MENTAEQYFVQTYIKKNRRDRLLFELSAEKRRYDGLSRFCHQAGELLDPAKIIAAGDDLERRPEFLRFVKHHDNTCYVISPNCQRLMAEATSLQLSGSADEGRAFSYLCYKQAC